jgi:hypothetical protein
LQSLLAGPGHQAAERRHHRDPERPEQVRGATRGAQKVPQRLLENAVAHSHHESTPQVLDIKRLNGVITAIRSDLSKYEEQLEECKKYRDFLAALTPAQWAEDQKIAAETRKEMRKAAKRAERLAKRREEVSAFIALPSRRDAESLSGTRKGTEAQKVAAETRKDMRKRREGRKGWQNGEQR